MGTRLTQQKRGKGGPAYRAPSHKYFTDARYAFSGKEGRAQVMGFKDDPARTSLLAELLLEDGRLVYCLAAEGLCKNDCVSVLGGAVGVGNVIALEKIPDGTPVFNIELRPGDGGRLARSTGAGAFVVGHDEDTGRVSVQLPSKGVLELNPRCLATIGIPAGGGRTEKPFKKAGAAFYAARARNHYYPRVRGTAMSAYDHPHGGKSLGKPSTVARSTPPGRKVGHVAASRTGRRRGRMSKQVGRKGGGNASKGGAASG